eukprot:3510393-Prymnesium_polylepis.1
MELDCDEELASAEHDRLLDLELAVLRAIPGCSGVKPSAYTGPELNKMGVQLRIEDPSNDYRKKAINVHGNATTIRSKLKAAREAKRRVAEIVGKKTVSEAEREVLGGIDLEAGAGVPAGAAPLTEVELDWLAD